MKRLFLLVILIGFLVGCSDESGVVTPVQETQKATWLKLNTYKSNLTLEKTFTKTKTLQGDKVGVLTASVNFKAIGGEDIKVGCSLFFPKNSFQGTETFGVTIDDQETTVDLSPSPFTFNSPINLTLSYKGVDLQNVDPNAVDFYYVAPNGELTKAEYDELDVDVVKGKLKVKNAKIPHFSRFGFVKAIQ
jgi:hypothetical protein